MIVKELDPLQFGDPLARAGRRTEEQMAFYLRRAFAAAEDIRVFHDLRLEHKGEIAQIDHLVLHRWGIVLIESKSVTTTLRVNRQGEWARRVYGRWQGMPSPVLQVKRQGDLLKTLLGENVERLLGKVLGLQFRFGHMPVDYLVAISDGGIIERVGNPDLPEVCKSDQVTERVDAFVKRYRKANSLMSVIATDSKDAWHTLRPQEMQRISDFLLLNHSPLIVHQATTASAVVNSYVPAPSKPVPDRVFDSPYDLTPVPPTKTETAREVCAYCGKPVTPAVTRYCKDQESRFGGKIYCMEHQRVRFYRPSPR